MVRNTSLDYAKGVTRPRRVVKMPPPGVESRIRPSDAHSGNRGNVTP